VAEEMPTTRATETPDEPAAAPEWLSVAIPRPATECYRLFAEVERIPEWLSVVRSAVVTDRDRAGRPRTVAFLARLLRSALGYSCRYRFNARRRTVSWATDRDSTVTIKGFAQFAPMGTSACLMTYSLEIEKGKVLGEWEDTFFANHASSAALNDFREFAIRVLPARAR
jgi:uncharacterized membrane protein